MNTLQHIIRKWTKNKLPTSVALLSIFFLVIIIVLTVRQLSKPTQPRIKASVGPTLSFSSSAQSLSVGQAIPLTITLDPGGQAISLAKLVISYDSSKLTRSTIGIQPDITIFPNIVEGPVYDLCSGITCTMAVTLSIGNDPTKVITAPATIATVNLQAIAPTDLNGTQVSFTQDTQLFSASSSAIATANVLSTANPITLVVTTPTPTPTAVPTDTPIPTPTNTPTPTPTPLPTPTPFPTPTPGAISTITLDNTSSQKGDGASLSWNHTIGSQSNRILLVAITTINTAVSSVTFNGKNLTQLATTNCSPLCNEIWYMTDANLPPTGIYPVVVNLPSADSLAAGSVSYYNVDQINSFGVPVKGSSPLTVSTPNTNQLVIDSMNFGSGGGSPNTGQTKLWYQSY